MSPQRTAGSVLDYSPMPTAYGFGVVTMTSGSASGMPFWGSEPTSELLNEVVSNQFVHAPGSEVIPSTAVDVHAVAKLKIMMLRIGQTLPQPIRLGYFPGVRGYHQGNTLSAADSVLWISGLPSLSAAQSLLRSYADFEFEDGMEDDFTPQLTELIHDNAPATIETIRHEITSGRLGPEFSWHILRRLGAIDDHASRQARLSLLQECLFHASRWIRDGAALGLAFLGDRSVIASLERAVARESIPDLKDDLSKALKHLAAAPTRR